MSLTWSPLTKDDAQALAVLSAEIEAADRAGENYSAEDLAEFLDNPLLELDEGTLALRDGERILGYVHLIARQTAEQAHWMFIGGDIHPDFRRRGYGRRLLDWAVERAPGLSERRYPGVPLELHAGSFEKNRGEQVLLEQVGFKPVRWFYDMEQELKAEVAAVPVPEGIEIVAWRPELSLGALAVRNAAFVDHWGSVPQTEETWTYFVGGRSFAPESSFLALDGDDVVGILLTAHYEADTAATGVKEAYIHLIGTLREWRGKGVAGSMIAHALAAFQGQGFGKAALNVDADSPSGAPGIYERAGFRTYRRNTAYVLALTPA
ncbi:GNAT family N-acetyltransferase [Nonomuraea sp. NPDC050663]|uniref:GNAT family N-acetyltransferase n=1 Tax=Nonomuraea sp. NPDC050663 TaxID=3364370 RepID=UPI0037A751F9